MKNLLFVAGVLLVGCSRNPFPEHQPLEAIAMPATLISSFTHPLVVDNDLILLCQNEDTCSFYDKTGTLTRRFVLGKRIKSRAKGRDINVYPTLYHHRVTAHHHIQLACGSGVEYYYDYKTDSFRVILYLSGGDFDGFSNETFDKDAILNSLPKSDTLPLGFQTIKALQQRYPLMLFAAVNPYDSTYTYLVQGSPVWYTFNSSFTPDTLGVGMVPYAHSPDIDTIYSRFAYQRNGDIALQELDRKRELFTTNIYAAYWVRMSGLYALQLKDTTVQFTYPAPCRLHWYYTRPKGDIFFILDNRAYMAK